VAALVQWSAVPMSRSVITPSWEISRPVHFYTHNV
jgi:hypothetical protein